MFRRGQKIIVVESSAKGGVHPKKNDIGYLDNLYLFPADRFILMDALFFGYGNDIKKNIARKAEKKRLIIDLGMKPKLLSNITKNRMSRQAFFNLIPICLTSVGYTTNIQDGFRDYPRPIGPCGIWDRNSSAMANQNTSGVKIPYGNIAPFSRFSNRKYSLKDCHDEELSAWLRTMNPMIDFLWSILNITSGYEINNSISKMAECIWIEIHNYFAIDVTGKKTKYRFTNTFLSLNSDKKNFVIEQIRKLEALDNMVLQRQDITFLNQMINKHTTDNIRRLESSWCEHGMLILWDRRSLFPPMIQEDINVLRSVFFRNIIMSKDIHGQLGMISKYFPSLGINSNKNVHLFQSIQKDVNNSSSALARIFDSSLVLKR